MFTDMSKAKTDKTASPKTARKDRAAEIANTLEWLITAFMLAFIFRAFIMEAFRIPTGSMADTLKGAHYRLRCCQCGYKYDYGFEPQRFNLPQDTIPHGYIKPFHSRCSSCGYYQPTGGAMQIINGDRILVLKCIYQFFEPQRWDVVVFKNPLDPSINYIKRLIARPEETVEIIDGDIYIDGQISRKPPKVQNELWMPVYDNDYQPVRPREGLFNGHFWQQPFNIAGSKWEIDKADRRKFRLSSPSDQINYLSYDSSAGNNFRATYAYDEIKEYDYMPYCSDLMVRFYAEPAGQKGVIGIELSKYKSRYRGWVDLAAGEMVIEQLSPGTAANKLKRELVKQPIAGRPALVKFANVDHQLIFQFGDEKLVFDLGRLPDDAGPRDTSIESEVKIFGSGKLTLSHIAVFRDIHYTAAIINSAYLSRAAEGNPFTLGKDEFFVLGDNSPSSADSRWWQRDGIKNNHQTYRKGIVPRDYLVGKALFVYWPGGFEFPWPKEVKIFLRNNSRKNGLLRVAYALVSLNWIPDVGGIRFIYGGSDKQINKK